MEIFLQTEFFQKHKVSKSEVAQRWKDPEKVFKLIFIVG